MAKKAQRKQNDVQRQLQSITAKLSKLGNTPKRGAGGSRARRRKGNGGGQSGPSINYLRSLRDPFSESANVGIPDSVAVRTCTAQIRSDFSVPINSGTGGVVLEVKRSGYGSASPNTLVGMLKLESNVSTDSAYAYQSSTPLVGAAELAITCQAVRIVSAGVRIDSPGALSVTGTLYGCFQSRVDVGNYNNNNAMLANPNGERTVITNGLEVQYSPLDNADNEFSVVSPPTGERTMYLILHASGVNGITSLNGTAVVNVEYVPMTDTLDALKAQPSPVAIDYFWAQAQRARDTIVRSVVNTASRYSNDPLYKYVTNAALASGASWFQGNRRRRLEV